MKKLLTLCIIYQHPNILLGMKKRGFGAGKWNGFGGKVEQGELVEDAVIREVEEEAGIKLSEIVKMGILEFQFEGNPELLEVHVFGASDFVGVPKETEEMAPQWFGVNELPFDKMWPDDRYWMPLFLAKKKFVGKFLFNNLNQIVSSQLQEKKVI